MTTSEFSLARATRLLLIALEAVVVASLVFRASQLPLETALAVKTHSMLTNLVLLSFSLLVLVQVCCLFSPMRRFALFSVGRLLLYALLAMTLVTQLA